ncbi:MAG: hypothetical protein FD123_3281 [Bacteroidetes bacterium]|nr:MAG: hypothetical protein FD123_3281 [Bacteroidota bacterium]
MAQAPATPFLFTRFFTRSWIWNILFTTVFAVIMLLGWAKVSSLDANRTWFFLALASSVGSGVHTLLLILFAIRRAGRKHWLAAGCFTIHLFVSGITAYYLFALWIVTIGFATIRN